VGVSRRGTRPSRKDHSAIRAILPWAALAAILAALCGLTLAADAHAACNLRACQLRVASKRCSQARPVPCIRAAAGRYRQPVADMLRVARCESGLDPYNSYAGHFGLFQFLRSTWATTPYRGRWIFSARYQALAAAWAWSVRRRSEWACQ